MIKIVSIALVVSIIIIYLKNINGELAILATIVGSLIIIGFSFDYIQQIVVEIGQMIKLSGLNSSFFKIIFKVTAIAYLVEFGANIIMDFGLNSLASKLHFVGKIMILSLSLPIFYSVFNLLMGIIQ